MKRKRGGSGAATTPSRPARKEHVEESEDEILDEIHIDTPSRSNKKQMTSYASTLTTSAVNGISKLSQSVKDTPTSQRRVLFSTPSKPAGEPSEKETPSITRNADRSARRKSSRRLIERTLEDDSEDEASDEDDALAREILEDEEDVDDGEESREDTLLPEPETPSKRRRGRPKGRTRKKSPSPPPDFPPHERYFWQNKTGSSKTSDNKIPSNALLNHDEYFQQMQSYDESHQEEREFLLSLHARSYDQWLFELEQRFSICLYGYGSKRQLLDDFAHFVHGTLETTPKIVIVNGYVPEITLRDILTTIAEVLLPRHLQLPTLPMALLEVIEEALSLPLPETPSMPKRKGKRAGPSSTAPTKIFLFINSLDSPPLRRQSTQSILARLVSHHSHRISLLATCDTVNFPLLWDAPLRTQFRFIFHDCTNFTPYGAEIDIVDTVNDLLGRSGRRVGGKDGAAFVLRSLPSNARALFRVLVAEQVAAAEPDDFANPATGAGAEADDDGPGATAPLSGRMANAAADGGVEFRLLYRKAVEELICTNENGFRTLLKEFYDHQMVESRRDALGTEKLVVPFRREELEALLEDLVD